MARYDAMKESFCEIELFGIPALFHDMRLDRNSVPEGLYLYEVRHDDDGVGEPAQIGKGILVNHLGSVITCEEIELDNHGHRDIEEGDWKDTGLSNTTVEDFMRRYR